MAAETHVEPVNGGLVTARDPSLLQPGELQQADNLFYRPGSQSAHRVPGRTEVATGLGGAVAGLVFCGFDFVRVPSVLIANNVTVAPQSGFNFNAVSVGARVIGDHIPNGVTVSALSAPNIVLSTAPTDTINEELIIDADSAVIAQANGKYKRAKAGTGALTFADLESVTEGDQLETIHAINTHVLINGKNDNRVLKADGTVIAHGLKPVKAAPAVTTASGGAWGLATGFYSYWTTEYDKVNDIESNYEGPRPKAVNIANTTTKATIAQPPRVNPSATHWRAYRSVKLDATSQAAADKEDVFPFGFLIGEAELKADGTQSEIVDGGGVTSTTTRNPTALGTVGQSANGTKWVNDGTSDPPTFLNGATTGTYGSFTANPAIISPDVGTVEVGTFGFTAASITPPITGITVVVRGKRVGAGRLSVQPIGKTFSRYFGGIAREKSVPLTTSDADHTLGSSTDTWLASGTSWDPSDFVDGTFRILLSASGFTGGDKVLVDTISVTITYGEGQQLGSTIEFPSITVKPFGIEISVGRNGRPPTATTGDMFEDSLVLDDITAPSLIRYSVSGKHHYFPSVYYMDMEEGGPDTVTKIKTVGEVLLVGMTGRIARVNYLPRDLDAEFAPGRARSFYERNVGIVGRRAGAVFSFVDGSQLLAFASRHALHLTDGYRTRLICPDVNWERLVDKTYLSRCILVNNPELHELHFYYVPLGSGTPTILTKLMRFSYHADHIKNGFLKGMGPCDVSVRSVAVGLLSDANRPLWTGTNDGKVNLENAATADGAVSPILKLRSLYSEGSAGEWVFQDAYVRHSLFGFSPASPFDISAAIEIEKLATALRTTTPKTMSVLAYPSDGNPYPYRPSSNIVTPNESGEGIALKLTLGASTVPSSVDYVTIIAKGLKRQQSKS